MKTHVSKSSDIKRAWYVLDASEVTLGRLSTSIASLLLGKSKADFSPHIDAGDFVVVINAAKLKVTGNKLTDKKYYRHSGYPSGLTTTPLSEAMQDPGAVIKTAVRGMLPVNKLRPARLERLKVYAGSEHKHAAQNPNVLSLTSKGKK